MVVSVLQSSRVVSSSYTLLVARAGTHVALPLSTLTRTLPTLQQLSGRMDLIAAQHQMTVNKPTASLLAAAVEVRTYLVPSSAPVTDVATT